MIKLFGFLEDIGMSDTQYNLGLMYFFFTYGLFEPVSNIMLRRVGPKIWLPLIVTLWGLITTLTSQASSYGGFVAIRLMLGITEAGLYPGAYFILSMWYTPKEIGTRMAIFYGANTTAGAFGGVIAYGVGGLDGNMGWRAWRWLFLIEGCITIFAGLCCIFCLPQVFPLHSTRRYFINPDLVLSLISTERRKTRNGYRPRNWSMLCSESSMRMGLFPLRTNSAGAM